jgi:chromosome segregation ATPase
MEPSQAAAGQAVQAELAGLNAHLAGMRRPLPEESASPQSRLEIDAQRDALRIQTAAVAAQQAALLEEELRLQQQQGALTQQQDQLATHLEEKRQRLVQLAEQVQSTRATLQREREELDRQTASRAEEQAACRTALDDERNKLQAERRRASRLRQRLKQRFHRRLLAERLQLRKRQDATMAQRQQLQQEWDQLNKERAALTEARLAFNGEAELGKRQLQAEWQKLWHEVKRWKGDRDKKEAELAARAQALRQCQALLTDAERALSDDRYQWEQKRRIVEQEIQGHETRLINQRRKLHEQQAELARTQAPLRLDGGDIMPMAVLVEADPKYLEPPSPDFQVVTVHEAHLRELEHQINQRVAWLDRVAEDLADQRLELVEHWQRVAQTQEEWLRAHRSAADQLQALAEDLPAKEQLLLARQDALEAAEANLQKRQHEISSFRQHVEGWAARVRLRETTWESERDRVLADVRGREVLTAKHMQAIVNLRQRWVKKRRQELDLLRAERAACEKLRLEYANLRQECWKRSLALEQQECDLTEKTLALEEYRQQFILRAQDAAGVESKLERIRRRWSQENAATMRTTAEQLQRLQDESAQLQQRGRELLKAAEEVTAREATLAQRQAAWEEKLTQAEAQEGRLAQQLESLLSQRDRTERQVAELQNEVERLARVLLDELEQPSMGLSQAA